MLEINKARASLLGHPYEEKFTLADLQSPQDHLIPDQSSLKRCVTRSYFYADDSNNRYSLNFFLVFTGYRMHRGLIPSKK
jgi:hypothetical protein